MTAEIFRGSGAWRSTGHAPDPCRPKTCYSLADPASYFVGCWKISRRVIDVRAGVEGHFSGTATFTRTLGALDYAEEGVLDFDGRRGPAGRTLRYRLDGPHRMIVEFADGRFFHDLDLRTGRWTVRHRCRDDMYLGEITALAPGHWRQVWRVAGPAKQLVLETDYTVGKPF